MSAMRDGMTRRRLLLGAASAASAAAVSGCAGGGSDGVGADGRVIVELWHGQSDTARKALEKLVADFNRTHPTIHVDAGGGGVLSDAMLQKVTAALAAGSYPDVAYIFGSLVTPFAVFLFRQFFLSLPREMEEAAWLDGCSRLRVLFSIVLPLARPALATVAVLTFLTAWNDLSWPLIAINHDTQYTLQLGLTTFQGQHHTKWSAVMAGNVITVLPVLIAFLLAQKTFVQSLTSSGIKG